MKWTPEKDAKLTELWNGGASAAQIARAIGGYSRNAVIGRKDRLGLAPRDTVASPNTYKTAHRTARPKLFVPKAVVEEPPAIGTLGDGGCKWPVGEPSEMLSCGHPRHGRYPYCVAHCSRAFQPAHNARDRNADA